ERGVAERRGLAAGGHEGDRGSRRVAVRGRVLQLHDGLVETHGAGAVAGEGDRPLPGAAPELEHIEAVDASEHPELRFGDAPCAPRPSSRTQVVTVQRLVVVGVGVPELAVVPLVLLTAAA